MHGAVGQQFCNQPIEAITVRGSLSSPVPCKCNALAALLQVIDADTPNALSCA
jgi:hypothetical protein